MVNARLFSSLVDLALGKGSLAIYWFTWHNYNNLPSLVKLYTEEDAGGERVEGGTEKS